MYMNKFHSQLQRRLLLLHRLIWRGALNALIEPTRSAEQRLRWRGGGVGRGQAAARIASAWVRAKVNKSE
eukprot:4734646-Pleurochrysis_carterae.AAC.1